MAYLRGLRLAAHREGLIDPIMYEWLYYLLRD